MKKQNTRTQKGRSKKKHQKGTEPAAPARRSFLNKVAWIAGGVAVLGGATLFGTRSVRATIAEHDLSRVGQGLPSVVQVHDPQCPTCTALQKQTRRALKDFSDDEVVYLVADIKTQPGQVFAGRFGVPHVTLLLFDAEGNHVETLQGMRSASELRPVFEEFLR